MIWARRKEERERIVTAGGDKKKEEIYVQSVRKNVEIFLSGCLRNKHSESKIWNHCMQKTRKHGVHRDKNGRIFSLKKKCAERKWQWRMYSPSGSKRYQLKRNRACGGGGRLLGVQACVHRGSASLFALRNAAGERVTWLGLDRVFWISPSLGGFLLVLFVFFQPSSSSSFFSPESDTSESIRKLEASSAGHVAHPAPRLTE